MYDGTSASDTPNVKSDKYKQSMGPGAPYNKMD